MPTRSQPPRYRLVLALVLALACVASAVEAQTTPPVTGSPARGYALVQRWCATCHDDPQSRAPKFSVIADRNLSDAEVARLVKGHSPLKPGFNLSDQDMADFIAYLKWQRTPPRR